MIAFQGLRRKNKMPKPPRQQRKGKKKFRCFLIFKFSTVATLASRFAASNRNRKGCIRVLSFHGTSQQEKNILKCRMHMQTLLLILFFLPSPSLFISLNVNDLFLKCDVKRDDLQQQFFSATQRCNVGTILQPLKII